MVNPLLEQQREDYQDIFEQDKVSVVRIREANTQAGTQGHEDEDALPDEKTIELNLNVRDWKSVERTRDGTTPKETWHATCPYNTDIEATDLVRWHGKLWKVDNMAGGAIVDDTNSTQRDHLVFLEFDLVFVSYV